MKILFLSLSGLTFDVTTPEKEPLGGTESSFCYLARQLAKNGHDVTLCARNVGSQELMGVKHVPECVINDYDILITNGPLRIASADKKPYHILWNHLAHTDQAIKGLMMKDVMQGIDCVVYVSEWQKNEHEKHFGKARKTVVIGNGLTPCFENMFSSVEEILAVKEDRAAYTSTPFRGLRLLPEIWKAINPSYIPCDSGYGIIENDEKPVELYIYSSMRVYQHDDTGYHGIYEDLRNTPNINYLGSVSQTKLCDALKKTAFLAYPCIFPETYCIAALEAIAAGCHVITTNCGALTSTCGPYADFMMVGECSADQFIKDYAWTFSMGRDYFISKKREWAEVRLSGVKYANHFTWEKRAQAWEEVFAAVPRNLVNAA